MAEEEPPSRLPAVTAPYFSMISQMSCIVAPRVLMLRPSRTSSKIAPSARCPMAVRGLMPLPWFLACTSPSTISVEETPS